MVQFCYGQKCIFVFSNHVSCGQYNCELTRDRKKLQFSDIIVFNARFAKGKENYLNNITLKYMGNKITLF